MAAQFTIRTRTRRPDADKETSRTHEKHMLHAVLCWRWDRQHAEVAKKSRGHWITTATRGRAGRAESHILDGKRKLPKWEKLYKCIIK